MLIVHGSEQVPVFGLMADRWAHTADSYSFRFFTAEEVDQILRDGARRGREGSHAAIERILKHEPGLQRIDLWQRIRRLKNPGRRQDAVRAVWSAEDESILREGYQAGWLGKRKAVSRLLKRHADWRPHLIWRHAIKLGLAGQTAPKHGQERSRSGWSEDDDRLLLDLAGYKRVQVMSKLLHRSKAAVRGRLASLGKSSRVHLEGFARSTLARELHLSTNLIQRLVVDGLLEVRDPRVTRESLDRLQRSGRLEEMRRNGVPATQNPAGSPAVSGMTSRAKRVWAEVATSLSLATEGVETLIARGVLKLYDPRITEKSLRNLCRRHGSLINSEFLNRETRNWLQSTMDFVPHAGEAAALRLTPLRKHARVVHRCPCGRAIRGNVFFRHLRRCNRDKLASGS
jgi:hypothetical protein